MDPGKLLDAYVKGARGFVCVDLRNADFSGADLSGVNLSDANLNGANLSGATLTGARLHRAFLVGANLTGANLTGADLGMARLRKALLSGSRLVDAYLYRADLTNTDLTNTDLTNTILRAARLSSRTAVGEWALSGTIWPTDDAKLEDTTIDGVVFSEFLRTPDALGPDVSVDTLKAWTAMHYANVARTAAAASVDERNAASPFGR